MEVKGGDIPSLANNVDKLYGSIENPGIGVPTMPGVEDVFIGSLDGKDWQYVLSATPQTAEQDGADLSVRRPQPDLAERGEAALQVRRGHPDHERRSGCLQRAAPGLARGDRDRLREDVGPNGHGRLEITGPGHGFTLANVNDWQGSIASAPLSHLGFHAPLLLTDSATTLPKALDGYYASVSPTYLNTPADGPYNMTYVIGSWNQISWDQQARVDYISEMHNRRVVGSNTGSTYGDMSPGT